LGPPERPRNDGWKLVANVAMDRYASGDDAAFSELYDVLAPRLHAFLARRTRDADVAEDLLQQTFLQIHAARRHFTPAAEVLPWSFAIARRLMIDGGRRKRRETPPPEMLDWEKTPGADDAGFWERASPDVGPEVLLQRAQVMVRLERELARLPEGYREAFELVKRDELSMAEAAEVLGTTVAAVRVRAHRCYVALRAAMADVADEWRLRRSASDDDEGTPDDSIVRLRLRVGQGQ
jgi:RNA polymerase sigma-70 factor (ECF subfamily)